MLWRRKRSQGDFSSEVQAHLDLEADRLMAEHGLPEQEAREQAQRAFGNVTRSEEFFYESDRLVWLDHLRRDAIYAFRQLSKDKGFTAIATATLALGIGATTSIFTLVHATLLKGLPYRDADRIISVKDTRLVGQSTGGLVGVPRFFDLRARSHSIDKLAFYYFDAPTLIAGSSSPTPLTGTQASGDFWDILGIRPALGRTFTAVDDKPKAPEVAVISNAVWKKTFGGDPRILNQLVQIDGKPATIIGVMPPGIQYPSKIEIWRPSHFDPADWMHPDNRLNGSRFVNVIGRLRPGLSLAAAQQDFLRIGEQLRKEFPASDSEWQFSSESLRDYLYGGLKPALLILLAASAVLLLIACINVASLLLSRATTRSREVALRRALGASQGRVVAQFLTENMILALAGGALGLLAALATVAWLGARLPGRLSAAAVELNWPVAGFTLALSLATSIFFGMPPALASRRNDLNANLKSGDRRTGGASGSGLRELLIALEVALSLILLVGASLLGESLWNLMKFPLGFVPDHVLSFRLELPWDDGSLRNRRFFDELQTKVEGLPGVIAAGQITALPTVDWHLRSNFDVDWMPRTQHESAVNVEDRHISGDYLGAMRIPLLSGRSFTDSDNRSKKLVALVNQAFARQYGRNQNLIRRHLINSWAQFEIVGIIGDVRGTAGSIARAAGPELYMLADGDTSRRTFVVRSTLPADHLLPGIRAAVHDLDANQAIREVATLDDLIHESVAQPRFNMGLLSSFAAIALLLAMAGIYGVVSYSVTQRSAEIGIRMALGATRTQICSLFLRRSLVAVAIGFGLGGALALLFSHLLRSQLYAVEPNHPLAYVVSILALLLPVFLASLRPALRAACLNPLETLRRD
jgi:putative ABC transport system permease protein